jgi:hypothetical protein
LRILLWGLVGLACLIGTAFLAGWLLPATREGRATALIAASAERILAVIKDVEAQPQWRKGLSSVVRQGDGWVETTSRGERITFTPVDMTTARIHLRFVSDAGDTGTWLAVLTPDGGATRMDVSESATVDAPLRRLIARLAFDPEAFATDYLAALKARSEAP